MTTLQLVAIASLPALVRLAVEALGCGILHIP
jgi:hypothetical protein